MSHTPYLPVYIKSHVSLRFGPYSSLKNYDLDLTNRETFPLYRTVQAFNFYSFHFHRPPSPPPVPGAARARLQPPAELRLRPAAEQLRRLRLGQRLRPLRQRGRLLHQRGRRRERQLRRGQAGY